MLSRRPRAVPWPRPVSLVVAVVGLVLTGLLTWAASAANARSNASLLALQVRQAASSLGAALPAVQSRLSDALTVATATGSPATFQKFASAKLVKSGFASESLWQRTPAGPWVMLTHAGSEPQLVRDGTATAFFAHARPGRGLHVTGILPGSPRRLGYADSASKSPYVVYAESALPPSRRLVVPRSSPFGDLNFAVYLGTARHQQNLIESSVPTPVQGTHADAAVPFGDTTITVVASRTRPLTGGVSVALPWIVLAAGAALSLASAATVEYVARRRRLAEQLAEDVTHLYAEQRSIAETLQQALLPHRLPDVPGMEIVARYQSGVRGVDVGGDWYDVVPVGEDRFVFVVGDVSGRGVTAAAVMASLRFSSRGFALEGHPPAAVLEHLAETLDIGSDRHFATVLCGLVDVPGHEVVLVSAGHPPPILCGDHRAAALHVRPTPPIGVGPQPAADPSVVTVGAGATLVAYTDGLVERRGESFDDGIRRLERAMVRDASSLGRLLDEVIDEMTVGSPEDDVAVIGFRWLS